MREFFATISVLALFIIGVQIVINLFNAVPVGNYAIQFLIFAVALAIYLVAAGGRQLYKGKLIPKAEATRLRERDARRSSE